MAARPRARPGGHRANSRRDAQTPFGASNGSRTAITPGLGSTEDEAIDRALETGRPIDVATVAIPRPSDGFTRRTPEPEGEEDNAGPANALTALGVPENHPIYRERLLRLLHRMLMRNIPMELCAQQLKLSIRATYALRADLHKQLKKEGSRVDFRPFVMDSLGFYKEVRGNMMRMAGDHQNLTVSERIKAANAARAAETDMHRFLAVAGFYDVAKFTPDLSDQTDPSQRSAGVLLQAVKSLINDDEEAAFDVMGDEESDDMDLRVVG